MALVIREEAVLWRIVEKNKVGFLTTVIVLFTIKVLLDIDGEFKFILFQKPFFDLWCWKT